MASPWRRCCRRAAPWTGRRSPARGESGHSGARLGGGRQGVGEEAGGSLPELQGVRAAAGGVAQRSGTRAQSQSGARDRLRRNPHDLGMHITHVPPILCGLAGDADTTICCGMQPYARRPETCWQSDLAGDRVGGWWINSGLEQRSQISSPSSPVGIAHMERGYCCIQAASLRLAVRKQRSEFDPRTYRVPQ